MQNTKQLSTLVRSILISGVINVKLIIEAVNTLPFFERQNHFK